MKMNIDGSVNVNMGGAEVGQGLRTIVRQIAAEALKIAPGTHPRLQRDRYPVLALRVADHRFDVHHPGRAGDHPRSG